jgi:hypothetical protein
MFSLYQVVKINFFTGLLSTLIAIPFAYAYELWLGKFTQFGFVDFTMVVVAPVLFGCAFAASGMIAFPFLKYLQKKQVIHNVL